MAQWAVIIPADRWATERLFHSETLTLPDPDPTGPPAGPAAADSAPAPAPAPASAAPASAAVPTPASAVPASAAEPAPASAVPASAAVPAPASAPASAVPSSAAEPAVAPAPASAAASAPASAAEPAAVPASASAAASAPASAAAVTPVGAPREGDEVVLIAGEEPQAVALGRFTSATEIAYTRRSFDEPASLGGLAVTGPLTPLALDAYRDVAARLGADRDRRTWLVSVDMPIEATSPGEAVRQFWSYIRELGPAELPAFVWPSGDELAMQAFVLGHEANQDPEEDDDED